MKKTHTIASSIQAQQGDLTNVPATCVVKAKPNYFLLPLTPASCLRVKIDKTSHYSGENFVPLEKCAWQSPQNPHNFYYNVHVCFHFPLC